MKTIYKAIFLNFFFLISTSELVKSQTYESFLDTTKSWNVMEIFYLPTSNYSTSRIKLKNDTLINNLLYKQVLESYDTINFYPNGFLREDSLGRVFYNNNNLFLGDQLLYDFSAKVGDTLNLPVFFGTNEAIVDSIDTVFAAGKNRKRISTSFFGGNVPDFWLEGIGSMLGLLTSGYVAADRSTDLLCFYQNSTLSYVSQSGYNYGCYLTIGLKDLDSIKQIKIYPTICNEYFTIEHQENERLEIKLFNSLGSEVLRESIL